jgi:predicted ATPase/DNA-binding winged helix-turn-helix (wHTH) protein
MATETVWQFGEFRLDGSNEQLWYGEQARSLKPKALAVLRYLVEHAGHLVTKEALFQAVWPDVVVSESVLTTCLREIRQALRDDARVPRYIQTVHRRGYRFIGTVVSRQSSVGSAPRPSPLRSQLGAGNWQLATPLVGREAELQQLHHWLDKTLNGERQIVFITGEPGIGKTALIDTFLVSLSNVQTLDPKRQTLDARPWIGQGQCIEHFGAGEAYLPVLAALGHLNREPGNEQLQAVLSRYAPTWLLQLPALVKADEVDLLQRKIAGATRERMLRELAEALEALTTEQPLVLVLEDLHWSDPSTLELLAFLARRRQPARLLVLGTYRPVEMLAEGHPLKCVTHELFAHGLCSELALRFLTEHDIATYLHTRFPVSALPTRLAQALYHRTGGNPLFLTSLVRDLVTREVLMLCDGVWMLQGKVDQVGNETPESIRHLVARQRERLTAEEQRILEAASLASAEFSAALVAAALETENVTIEAQCNRLAERQQFLGPAGLSEWPDGTVAARYGFQHAVYQQLWHERVSIGQAQEWQRRMGERLEAAYGQRASEVAAELAVHFEQGREYRRAICYHQQAAETAMQRNAHQEAIAHLTKGLELLTSLPDSPERSQQELPLQISLGGSLIAIKGYSAPEVEKPYIRALELCQQVGDTAQLFPTLWGLWEFSVNGARYKTAHELAEQCLMLAQSAKDPALLVEAHYALGSTSFQLGEIAAARSHFEDMITLYDLQQHSSYASLYVQDPGVVSRVYIAWALWFLGYPEQALQRSQEALALARDLSHPYSLGIALIMGAILSQYRQEVSAVHERAEEGLMLTSEQEFAFWLAQATIMDGWALAEQGQREKGIIQMRHGLAAYKAIGAEIVLPYFLALLAEAYGKAGQTEEGLAVLAEALALVQRIEERYYEAELYRLKGQLTLQSQTSLGQVSDKSQARLEQVTTSQSKLQASLEAEAEACFWRAIEIARKQQAKSLELRALMSLVRLWQQQATQYTSRNTQHEARTRLDAACKTLSEIYNWFTEGFDTKDLREARALLEEYS